MTLIQRSSITCLTLGLLVLFTSACGGKDEPAATREKPEVPATAPQVEEPATPPQVEEPEVATSETGEPREIRYSGETPAGEKFMAQIGGEVSLPSALPSDLPLYPNAVPYSAMELSNTAIVSFESWDPASKVYGFYSENLPSAGWNIDNEVNMGGQRVIKATKGGQEAEVRIESTEDGARISFLIQPAG
jgi:hypothetical protein